MELTPDEKLARHNKAIRRFKVIVRLVIANLYWLGDIGEIQLTTNVKRNIALLLRKKAVKSSLTIREKSILSKPKDERTEKDKEFLSKAIGGLKCFRKYPPQVKSKLAAVTYFVYYGPGREIVRQNQEAHAMYFILTGECRVKVGHHIAGLKEEIVEDSGILHPGTMFGEIALLHGTKRLATITTLTNCEMLMVKREDFDSVLKETVLKSWNEIGKIINNLAYFTVWDSFTKRECSIVSRVKTFVPDETILGDEIGFPKYSYFIVSGTCCIIEQLNVKFIIKQGVEYYELIGDDEVMAEDAMSLAYCRKYHHQYSDTLSTVSKVSKGPKEEKGIRSPKLTRISEVRRSSLISRSSQATASTISSRISKAATRASHEALLARLTQKATFAVGDLKYAPRPSLTSRGSQVTASTLSKGTPRFSETYVSQKARFSEAGFKSDLTSEESHFDVPSRRRLASFYIPKIKIEKHFIKICEFPPGACFNIGENFIRKRVVAMVPSTCLLVPREFITKNNIGSIFDGVHEFLKTHVPNTRQVFKRFVEQEKFRKYRRQLVKEILNNRMVNTNNSIHNVPYSIRLREGVDTEYFNK